MDALNEHTIPLKQALRWILPNWKGKPPARQTMINWCNKGLLNSHTGERIHLEHTRIGRRYYTTIESAQRFRIRHNEIL